MIEAISVERITFQADRVRLEVCVAPAAPKSTDPILIERVLALRPTLAAHSCVNGEGPLFSAVMDHTSLPHLLEHLIIDEQVHAAHTDPERTFAGVTKWIDKASGRALIELSFADDMVAVRSIRNAAALLNACVARDTMD